MRSVQRAKSRKSGGRPPKSGIAWVKAMGGEPVFGPRSRRRKLPISPAGMVMVNLDGGGRLSRAVWRQQGLELWPARAGPLCGGVLHDDQDCLHLPAACLSALLTSAQAAQPSVGVEMAAAGGRRSAPFTRSLPARVGKLKPSKTDHRANRTVSRSPSTGRGAWPSPPPWAGRRHGERRRAPTRSECRERSLPPVGRGRHRAMAPGLPRARVGLQAIVGQRFVENVLRGRVTRVCAVHAMLPLSQSATGCYPMQ